MLEPPAPTACREAIQHERQQQEEKAKTLPPLSDEERYDIIGYMDQGMSFRAIGRRIGRSASTVEREDRRGLERKKGWQKTPCPYLGKKGVSVCNQCRHKTECLRPKVYYHATVVMLSVIQSAVLNGLNPL